MCRTRCHKYMNENQLIDMNYFLTYKASGDILNAQSMNIYHVNLIKLVEVTNSNIWNKIFRLRLKDIGKNMNFVLNSLLYESG